MTKEAELKEIARLEHFFSTTKIPFTEYKTVFSIVKNIPVYIDTLLTRAKSQAGNQWFSANLSTLQELESVLLNYAHENGPATTPAQ